MRLSCTQDTVALAALPLGPGGIWRQQLGVPYLALAAIAGHRSCHAVVESSLEALLGLWCVEGWTGRQSADHDGDCNVLTASNDM